jgi:hypothetical protein
MTAEAERLASNNSPDRPWYLWGPYLAERAWGTVREDYSANGDAWNYFPHDHARSRAFRWSEDGIGGISDNKQRLCFAFAFWNERDRILKERLFGLTGPQGNHGEDVKEVYFYTDNTPTHSYMRMSYYYPHAAFPYDELINKNATRSKLETEFELWHTGALETGFFDIDIEYAKASPDDLLIRVSATNRGEGPATLHILPTLWFRNTWSWGRHCDRPTLSEAAPAKARSNIQIIEAAHPELGNYRLHCDGPSELLFTENETNTERLWSFPNSSRFVKDALNEYIVGGNDAAINPLRTGTKAAAHWSLEVAPNKTKTIQLRLQKNNADTISFQPFAKFNGIMNSRIAEADEFFASIVPPTLTPEHRNIHRQSLAGMLWSKQFYHYIVEQWLDGDPGQPPPPKERKKGRNAPWRHLYNERVTSMPDKWEFPWYASWDLAFHCIPLALIDPGFAKDQLDLILREWYQHPNGQVPAYEWNFSDVNPPVLAWGAWRVYKIEQKNTGSADREFLETVFHKLLINFTWWVNRKDSEHNNIFEGGFLGLDNIGVFDRSAALAGGGYLEQSDATSWMGMFCLNMMRIALELARNNRVYENIATKFFEHFLGIAAAMNNVGDGLGLWDDADEFYYDVLRLPNEQFIRVRVRSLVGLMPLLAVETIEPELLEAMPGFKARLEWYLANRPDLAALVSRWQVHGVGKRHLIALTRGHRMKRLLRRMLDPNEFLSDYGVRSLSRFHRENPYALELNGKASVIKYEPSESETGIFGGNSNWRGPIWMPINYLLIESLQKFHHYYGDEFRVECPTGSGEFFSLDEIANNLSNRLIALWLKGKDGRRPFAGPSGDRVLGEGEPVRYWFHEYFHGDTGEGLGASHQTGWTGLVAKLIQQQGSRHTIIKRDPFTDL